MSEEIDLEPSDYGLNNARLDAMRSDFLEQRILEEMNWLKAAQARVVGSVLVQGERRFWFGVTSIGLIAWGIYATFDTSQDTANNPLLILGTLVLSIITLALSIYSTLVRTDLRSILAVIEDRLVKLDEQYFGEDALGVQLRSNV